MSLLCAYISLRQQYYKTCVGCEIICVREIISDSWNEFSEKKKNWTWKSMPLFYPSIFIICTGKRYHPRSYLLYCEKQIIYYYCRCLGSLLNIGACLHIRHKKELSFCLLSAWLVYEGHILLDRLLILWINGQF